MHSMRTCNNLPQKYREQHNKGDRSHHYCAQDLPEDVFVVPMHRTHFAVRVGVYREQHVEHERQVEYDERGEQDVVAANIKRRMCS